TNLAENGREFDESTYRINLDWLPDENDGGPSRGTGGNENGEEGVVAKSDYPSSRANPPIQGVVPNSDHLVAESKYVVPKHYQRWSENETGVVPKSDIQETDQETVQETAAPEASSTGEFAADAFFEALVQMLVAQGVGQSVAEVLARTKPKECRRQLEYLPFA